MTVSMIVVLILTVAVVIWLIIPSKNAQPRDSKEVERDRMIGLLTGMMGGDIRDAAVARYALQRFEEDHGRAATQQDLGVVVSMIQNSSYISGDQ
jgi:uncharacterized membrane-anchored protein